MELNIRGEKTNITEAMKQYAEEKIQKLKTVKRNLVDSVISVDRNIVKSLTMDDIKEIFSVD